MLGLTGLLFALGFQPFVARSLVFERPELRPFYNLWSQIVPHCAAGLVVYGAGWRRPGFVAMGVGVALLGIIGGNRTVAILTLIQVAVILAMPRRFRNLLVVVTGGLALATAAMMTSLLRADGSASRGAELTLAIRTGRRIGLDDPPTCPTLPHHQAWRIVRRSATHRHLPGERQ